MDDLVAAVLAEARAAVAAGRTPDVDALAARLRAAGPSADDALTTLERIASVARARGTLAEPAAPAPVRARPLRAALRTRPTLNANMDVRRERREGSFLLAWDAAPAVVGWEVRISERPDLRSEYAVRETRELPAGATSVELPLGDLPLRVHVLGRTRDGRLLRRAVASGLTRDGWDDRWQRRASAA